MVKRIGLISSLISLPVPLLVSIFIYVQIGFAAVFIVFLLPIISSKVIVLKADYIFIWSVLSLFTFKPVGIKLSEVKWVNIGDGGKTLISSIQFYGLDDFRFKTIRIILYPFERRRFAKYLEQNNIIVDGNGIY